MNIKKKILSSFVVSSLIFTSVSGAFAALPDFVDLAKNTGKAVVNISTETTIQGGQNFGNIFPNEMFRNMPREFEQFFKGFNNPNQERKTSSLGSGFIISEDGFIVTNNHVVEDADKIFVNFEGDKGKASSIEARIVGTDPETDLALLKVEPEGKLPTLKFGDSDKSDVGEWVLAIGNPFGLGHTVTAGIISAKGRNIQSGPFDDYIQTDTSINPGNSGGPLINMEGEVIGINTAIIASGQGIGFAIPSSQASKIIESLKEGKKVSRGWLGVSIQDIDENTSKALGLESLDGALISSVMPDEPADKAGVTAGDVVIKVNNTPVSSSAELLQEIAAIEPGKTANLTVVRDGKEQVIKVVLGERETSSSVAAVGSGDEVLGMKLRPITKSEGEEFNLKSGLVIAEINPQSEASQHGLRTGDIILGVNTKSVKSFEEFEKIVNDEGKKRGAVFLHVRRDRQEFSLALPIEK